MVRRMSAKTAVRAAFRLYALAIGLLVGGSILLGLLLVAIVVAILSSTSNLARDYLIGAAMFTLVAWALLALVCLACQVVAEHVELHARGATATARRPENL